VVRLFRDATGKVHGFLLTEGGLQGTKNRFQEGRAGFFAAMKVPVPKAPWSAVAAASAFRLRSAPQSI